MMGGAKAHCDGIVAFSQTDFNEELKEITVPVLGMHGCAYEISLQTPLASPISVNDAASHLYGNAHKFHKVINVGLFAVRQGCLRFVVVKTGFQSVVWEQTWNQPAGWDPFKEIIFNSIEVGIGLSLDLAGANMLIHPV